MLKTQPRMKEEEEEENNKDLWEIGALNLLIAPLHITSSKEVQSCRGGVLCTTSMKRREGKGRERGKREGKKL